MRPRTLGATLVAALLAAACSLLPGTSSDFDVNVENGTTLDIGIVVNGEKVGVVKGGEGMVVLARELGPLPWTVTAVTSTGRQVASMTVEASMGCVDVPGGGTSCTGALALVQFVCGRFAMYAAAPFAGGPAPAAGEGEPCVP